MTPTDTKALRELYAKATPGPWSAHITKGKVYEIACVGRDGSGVCMCDAENVADFVLTAAMFNALPSLLTEVEALREALKPFASDATLFPSAAAGQRDTLRPAMYFAISDYDRARAALSRGKRPEPKTDPGMPPYYDEDAKKWFKEA